MSEAPFKVAAFLSGNEARVKPADLGVTICIYYVMAARPGALARPAQIHAQPFG